MCGITALIRKPTWLMYWSIVSGPRSIRTKRVCTPSVEWDMPFALLNRLQRSFSFRLNLWYALIFTTGTAGLLLLAYYLLVSAIQAKDEEFILARLKEYAAIYQAGGANALRNWAMREQASSEEQSFFVRLRTPVRTVVAIRVPQEWGSFREPEENALDRRRYFVVDRIPKDARKDFALARAT